MGRKKISVKIENAASHKVVPGLLDYLQLDLILVDPQVTVAASHEIVIAPNSQSDTATRLTSSTCPSYGDAASMSFAVRQCCVTRLHDPKGFAD